MNAARMIGAVDPFKVLPRAAHAGGAVAGAAGRVAIRAVEGTVSSPHTAEVVAVVVRSPLSARAVDDLVDVLLARGVVERAAERVLAGPEIDRLLSSVFDSARMAELADRVAMRVLESDELWLIVDRIVNSPSFRSAVAQQGAGFVDQMADGVAERSRRADDRLERTARRLLRRRTPGVAAPPVTG